MILPTDDHYFLSWKLVVEVPNTLISYTYYVDAITGEVIKKNTNVISQGHLQSSTMTTRSETSAVLNRKLPIQKPSTSEDAEKPANQISAPKPDALTPADAIWETILSENFDVNNFPYSPWQPFDNNGATGGELFWDDQSCVSHDPSWSLWAADGGVNHLNACVDNYAHNMDSWVIYGPFSLAGSTDGLLDFHYNNVSEANFDYFKWLVSVDGTHFSGYQVSGNSNGWQYGSIDFKNVPTLGNITGRSQVWIAFVFTSDGSIASGKGAFVDDVAIKRMTSSNCTGVSGLVKGYVFGKNKSELQLSAFRNTKVILNHTFAFDSYTVTNVSGNYSSSECPDFVRVELQGFSPSNFVKVLDCNGGACPNGNGDLLSSGDVSISSQVANYVWNEDEDDKKEVSVFFHVNEIHDWFKQLTGSDLMNYQMQAYVDWDDDQPNSCPNAYYHPGTRNIYFCPSDYSKESDVIYHEFTHGVVDHIPNYDLPNVDETGAINEGIADYFAASKNNDAQINGTDRVLTAVVNYSDKCNQESLGTCGPTQYWLRSTSPDFPRNDYGYVHHNSLVASGSLWRLRQSIGAELCRQLGH